ncbi:MAG: hypothetical protein RR128_01645 [Clostridium sp.]
MNKNEKIAVALGIAGMIILNVYINGRNERKIMSLQNEISNLNSSIASNFSGLSYNMEEFEKEIKAQLEKQASILASHNVDFAFEEGKLQIKLSAVPKEFNGEESVKFIVGEEELNAVNDGGAFVATCSIAPRDTVTARVQFIKSDTIRQEELPQVNVKDELAISPNVIFGDTCFDLGDKKETYKNLLILSCYNENNKVGLMNPREITLVIKDDNTKKVIKEIPMEIPPSEIINSEIFKGKYDDTIVYSADLSGVMDMEGKCSIDCNLVADNGIKYNFQVGNFTRNKQENYSQWGNMSGVVYPSFD